MLERIKNWWLRQSLGWSGLTTIGSSTTVDIFQLDGTVREDLRAEVNSTWDYSVIDERLARELNLLGEDSVVEELVVPELGAKKRPLIMVSFTLGGRPKRSRWVVADREKSMFPVVIGRNDLAGFLVQTSKNV